MSHDFRTLEDAIESGKVILAKVSGGDVSSRALAHAVLTVADYGAQFLPENTPTPPPHPVMMAAECDLKAEMENLVASGDGTMRAGPIPWKILIPQLIKWLLIIFADTPTP